jgi:hypothetical protein
LGGDEGWIVGACLHQIKKHELGTRGHSQWESGKCRNRGGDPRIATGRNTAMDV